MNTITFFVCVALLPAAVLLSVVSALWSVGVLMVISEKLSNWSKK